MIAARRHIPDGTLLPKLTAPYQKLLWTTIATMPQRYHTVKALALLCTWPVPLRIEHFSEKAVQENKAGSGIGLTETDPTFMLSGIMMQIALQTSLHRVDRAQEFVKLATGVSYDEVRDRQLTWAVCNIVAHQ